MAGEIGPSEDRSRRVDQDEFGTWFVEKVPDEQRQMEVPMISRLAVAGGREEDGSPVLAFWFGLKDGKTVMVAMTVDEGAELTQMMLRAMRDLGIMPRPGMN